MEKGANDRPLQDSIKIMHRKVLLAQHTDMQRITWDQQGRTRALVSDSPRLRSQFYYSLAMTIVIKKKTNPLHFSFVICEMGRIISTWHVMKVKVMIFEKLLATGRCSIFPIDLCHLTR